MLDERWYQGHLTEMGRPECLDLLRVKRIGRVAYDDNGPVVVPVNYVMYGEDVLFRTSPHTALGRGMAGTQAAFQIDDFDEFNQAGWSVLVRGRSSYVEYDDLPAYESERPVPWVDGNRPLYVRIRPISITGRRLLPG